MQTVGSAVCEIRRPYTVVVRSTLLPGILEERLAPKLFQAARRDADGGLELCNNPEFLRETTAIRDYDQPPFVVVGAESGVAAEPVLDIYDKIDCPKFVTDGRTAAMVKYASNALHALKVSFANEIGTLARAMGTDGRKVMRIVCADNQLNISPAYLQPGFAFGGSCLPKDVRALVRYAQQNAIRADLIESILPSNEAHLQRAFQQIRDAGRRRVGLVGLSFKAGTDDLRESPQVMILAELLLGRGYDLRIYDPEICLSRLLGKNLSYVEQHLPHLSALLVDSPEALREHAELLVLGTDLSDKVNGWKTGSISVIDLRQDLVAATSPEEADA
jgi:GDP-mannose 6-dehydrogenase